jgi:hypothetical protein
LVLGLNRSLRTKPEASDSGEERQHEGEDVLSTCVRFNFTEPSVL